MLKQTLSEAEGFALVVSMTWPARDELACFVALTATQSDNLLQGGTVEGSYQGRFGLRATAVGASAGERMETRG